MGWISFQEKAKKLNSGLYFKKTEGCYEVWERPKLAIGTTSDYCCMKFPFEILERPQFNWNKALDVLKRMMKTRDENRQLEELNEMRARTKAKEDEKKKHFQSETVAFFKDNRKAFVEFADDQGITSSSVRSRMKGLSDDDAKKEIKKKFDGK